MCKAVLEGELAAGQGFQRFRCELAAGHDEDKHHRPKGVAYSQKHREGGVSWTDQGAARTKAEWEAKQK